MHPRPVVFITGASAGIGAACVEAFAQKGWTVVAAARRLERLEELARAIEKKQAGATVLPLRCDVASAADVTVAFDQTRARFGRLEALINNAGYGVYGAAEELPIEAFKANMETNYFGVVRCTQAALPLLKEAAARRSKPRPALVMVSSFVGGRALPGMSAYCASKFALEGFSESLRVELRDAGISVSVINPGVTKTNFFASAHGERPKNYLPPSDGMAAEAVAQVIYKAVLRPRRNAWLTLAGQAGIVSQWLSPRLLDRVLLRTWRKRK